MIDVGWLSAFCVGRIERNKKKKNKKLEIG